MLQCLLLFRWLPRFSGLSGFRRQNRNIWFFSLSDGFGGGGLWQRAGRHMRDRSRLLRRPLYSFYVDNPLDMGELGCFIGLAVIGAKCAADLLRPAVRVPQRVRG